MARTMKLSMLLGCVFGCLWLSACSQSAVKSAPPAYLPNPNEVYLIGVGDQLSVQVWKSPELSVGVPVRPDGNISVPLAGDVFAKGKQAEELAQTIASKLNQFIRNPEVTVIIASPASADFLRRVRVTGAVNAPSSIPHQQGITVLDLVLSAGGLTPYARGNKAILYRQVEGEVQPFDVRVNDILDRGRLQTNYELAPGDILTVPERAF